MQRIQPTPHSVAVHMATQHTFVLIPITLCPVIAIEHPGNLRISLSRHDRLSGRRRDMSGKPRHTVTVAIAEHPDKALPVPAELGCNVKLSLESLEGLM